jgi:hypothetical protein
VTDKVKGKKMVESNKKDALGMTCLGQLIERRDATIDSIQRDPDNVNCCSLSFPLSSLPLSLSSYSVSSQHTQVASPGLTQPSLHPR